MKKLLSVLLTFAMLMSLVAGSAFSTGAKSIDIAQINKAIPDAMLSYSIEDKIASLKSEVIEDEPAFGEEFPVEGEVEAEGEDVVFEYEDVDVGDAPAAMPEEGEIADVMPAL